MEESTMLPLFWKIRVRENRSLTYFAECFMSMRKEIHGKHKFPSQHLLAQS